MSLKNKKLRLFLIWLAGLVLCLHAVPKLERKLKVHFCDVGQADATLVVHKNWQMLVDAGGSNRKVLDCLDEYMPIYDKKIELAVFTHPQQDHAGGFESVMDFYKIEQVWTNGVEGKARGYVELMRRLEKNKTILEEVRIGDELAVDKVRIKVWWPSEQYIDSTTKLEAESGGLTALVDPNFQGVVLEVGYGSFNALLMADVDSNVQPLLIKEGVVTDVEVLKVPHHGSKLGLNENFLEAISPELSVISVGKKNNFGHPHAQLVDKLLRSGSKVLRTDVSGTITVETDGKSWWVR